VRSGFASRTVAKLRNGLIRSDDVAIYELIKTAVDTASPRGRHRHCSQFITALLR